MDKIEIKNILEKLNDNNHLIVRTKDLDKILINKKSYENYYNISCYNKNKVCYFSKWYYKEELIEKLYKTRYNIRSYDIKKK